MGYSRFQSLDQGYIDATNKNQPILRFNFQEILVESHYHAWLVGTGRFRRDIPK